MQWVADHRAVAYLGFTFVGDVQRPGAYDVSSLSTLSITEQQEDDEAFWFSLRVAHPFVWKELCVKSISMNILVRGVPSAC